jgi:outer membrane murein-binding lipoprotein Lpp
MESGKLYTGTGTYNNTNTPFYLDSTGDFSLKDKLVWDQSESALAIVGNLTITGGPSAAQLAALNTTTSSLESQVGDLNTETGSLATQVGELNTETGSLQTGRCRCCRSSSDTRYTSL